MGGTSERLVSPTRGSRTAPLGTSFVLRDFKYLSFSIFYGLRCCGIEPQPSGTPGKSSSTD